MTDVVSQLGSINDRIAKAGRKLINKKLKTDKRKLCQLLEELTIMRLKSLRIIDVIFNFLLISFSSA